MSKQKKSKKTVSVGIAKYKTTFNNTIITISDILEIQFVGLLLELWF
jgi:ribosomal protein S11